MDTQLREIRPVPLPKPSAASLEIADLGTCRFTAGLDVRSKQQKGLGVAALEVETYRLRSEDSSPRAKTL
jgi:hypothetical protein